MQLLKTASDNSYASWLRAEYKDTRGPRLNGVLHILSIQSAVQSVELLSSIVGVVHVGSLYRL
jgi:hypothetical protein